MIIGIGTDLVNIERIEKIYNKHPKEFSKRILSSKELVRFNELHDRSKVNFLAKRFAGKEAVAKALGTGISNGLNFKDISILNLANGQPFVKITGDKSSVANGKNFYISLSDDHSFAIAFVVISH